MSYKNQSDLYLEDNISKYPAIELLCKLGFTYISPEDCMAQRGSLYDVLLKDILRKQLNIINQFEFGGITYKFTADNVEKAIKAGLTNTKGPKALSEGSSNSDGAVVPKGPKAIGNSNGPVIPKGPKAIKQ